MTSESGQLECVLDELSMGVPLVRLEGRLNRYTTAAVRRVVLKALAEAPDAVVIDVSAVEAGDRAALTVFAALARHGRSRWPGSVLLLCGASPSVRVGLGALGVTRHVELWPDVDAAVVELARRVRRPVLSEVLERSIEAPKAARGLAEEACSFFGFPDLVGDAEMVASELTANVVEHGAGRPCVRFERRDDGLLISVTDDAGLPLRPRRRPAVEERGRGLLLVAALTASWGAEATPAGGKVVWALLRPAR